MPRTPPWLPSANFLSVASMPPGPQLGKGTETPYPLQGLGAQGGAVLRGEGPGALLWGPLKVTLWPVRHSSPPLPAWRPGAKAFVPGSEELRWQQGPRPRFLPWASVQGASPREGWESDLLGGLENRVGWASLKFQKTTCSRSSVSFHWDKVCLQGRQACFPRLPTSQQISNRFSKKV